MDPTPSPQQFRAAPVAPAHTTYAPGWYPDPLHRFEFRYHNGQAWTGDVSSDGIRFLDPIPAVFAATTPRSTTKGKEVAAFVLAVGSILVGWVPFLCALAVVAAFLAVVFGFSALRQRRAEAPRPGRGLALAAVMLAPLGFAVSGVGVWLTVVTVREFDQYAFVGKYSVATTRCEVDAGVAHFEGTVTNESGTTRSYHLVVEFLRPGTGNSLYTSSADVRDVDPGATRRWAVTEVVQFDKLDCRVSSVTGPLPFDDLNA